MKMKLFAGVCLILITLAGCGGSGGDTAAGTPPATTIVQGTLSKGIIRDGTVRIYALNADGSKGTLLKETSTDTNGRYVADISPYTGPVLMEGFGTFTDEATGTSMTIPSDMPLRAAYPNVSGSMRIAVTAITELAVRHALTLTRENITAANRTVSDIFAFDIIETQPVEPVAAALRDTTTTQSQRDYTIALATVSQMGNGAPVANTLTALASDIAENNGLSQAAAASFQNALNTFLTTNPNNQTGVAADATNLAAVGCKKAVIRLGSSGASASEIAGAQLTLSVPVGATVVADRSNGEVLDGALTLSGVVPAGALIKGKYTPEQGTVKLALISTTPFGTGDFAILTIYVPTGTAITADGVAISGVKFVNLSAEPLSGISVTKAVTVQ